jgi:hypothetical protein
MEPNDISHLSTDNFSARVFKNSSLNKLSKTFAEEKKYAEEMNAAKDEQNKPAPYYDELHFADYE